MRAILSPLGWIYGSVSTLRRRLYDANKFETVRLSKPVISVGNLTVGGTGKTPLVDFLLTSFEEKGIESCVLTRGYGRKSQKSLVVEKCHVVDDVGDEPLWLFHRHPKTKILVSQIRALAAREIDNVEVFILDDGFQHYQLKRDFEIVLLDATRPLWHYEILPRGYGRENFSALGRADLIILTKSNIVPENIINNLKDRISKVTDSQVILSHLLFDRAEDFGGKNINIEGKKIYCLSGIGNPQSFENVIIDGRGIVAGHRVFPDHAHYTKARIKSAIEEFKNSRADFLLMTEKDAVKWRSNNFMTSDNFGYVVARLKFSPQLPSIYDLALNNFN